MTTFVWVNLKKEFQNNICFKQRTDYFATYREIKQQNDKENL